MSEEAKIILEYHDFVRYEAFKAAPYPGVTEDIVQQVFVEFLEKADQWNVDSDLRPLLRKMTQFVAARLWREKSRRFSEIHRAIAEQVRLSLADEETMLYENELPALKHCMGRLPEKSRSLITMRYFNQLPIDEIAENMQMKSGNVYKSICRIRELLKECILQTMRRESSHASR